MSIRSWTRRHLTELAGDVSFAALCANLLGGGEIGERVANAIDGGTFGFAAEGLPDKGTLLLAGLSGLVTAGNEINNHFGLVGDYAREVREAREAEKAFNVLRNKENPPAEIPYELKAKLFDAEDTIAISFKPDGADFQVHDLAEMNLDLCKHFENRNVVYIRKEGLAKAWANEGGHHTPTGIKSAVKYFLEDIVNRYMSNKPDSPSVGVWKQDNYFSEAANDLSQFIHSPDFNSKVKEIIDQWRGAGKSDILAEEGPLSGLGNIGEGALGLLATTTALSGGAFIGLRPSQERGGYFSAATNHLAVGTDALPHSVVHEVGHALSTLVGVTIQREPGEEFSHDNWCSSGHRKTFASDIPKFREAVAADLENLRTLAGGKILDDHFEWMKPEFIQGQSHSSWKDPANTPEEQFAIYHQYLGEYGRNIMEHYFPKTTVVIDKFVNYTVDLLQPAQQGRCKGIEI